jgi:hypothetical protein
MTVSRTNFAIARRAFLSMYDRRTTWGQDRLALAKRDLQRDRMIFLSGPELDPTFLASISASAGGSGSPAAEKVGPSVPLPVSRFQLPKLDLAQLQNATKPDALAAAIAVLGNQSAIAESFRDGSNPMGGYLQIILDSVKAHQPNTFDIDETPSELRRFVLGVVDGKLGEQQIPNFRVIHGSSLVTPEIQLIAEAVNAGRDAEALERCDMVEFKCRGYARRLVSILRSAAMIRLGHDADSNLSDSHTVFSDPLVARRVPWEIVEALSLAFLLRAYSRTINGFEELAALDYFYAFQMASLGGPGTNQTKALKGLLLSMVRLRSEEYADVQEKLTEIFLGRINADEVDVEGINLLGNDLIQRAPNCIRMGLDLSTGDAFVARADALRPQLTMLKDKKIPPWVIVSLGQGPPTTNQPYEPSDIIGRVLIGSAGYDALVARALSETADAYYVLTTLARVHFSISDYRTAVVLVEAAFADLVTRLDSVGDLPMIEGAAESFAGCAELLLTLSLNSLRGKPSWDLPKDAWQLQLPLEVAHLNLESSTFLGKIATIALATFYCSNSDDSRGVPRGLSDSGTIAESAAQAFAETNELLGQSELAMTGYLMAIAKSERFRAGVTDSTRAIRLQENLSPLHVRLCRTILTMPMSPSNKNALVTSLEASRCRLLQYQTRDADSEGGWRTVPSPTAEEISSALPDAHRYVQAALIPERYPARGAWTFSSISPGGAIGTRVFNLEMVYRIAAASVANVNSMVRALRLPWPAIGGEFLREGFADLQDSTGDLELFVRDALLGEPVDYLRHLYISPDSYLWDIPSGILEQALISIAPELTMSFLTTGKFLTVRSFESTSASRLVLVAPEVGYGWERVRDSLVEVAHSLGLDVEVLVTSRATMENISAALSHADLFLFLGHGVSREPTSASWCTYDGFMSSLDISRLSASIAPPRVQHVLSLSCFGGKTDYESNRLAREVKGLPDALLAGGCTSFIGSQWPMELESSRQLGEIWLREIAGLNGVRLVTRKFAALMCDRTDIRSSPAFWAGVRHWGK